MVYDMRNYTAIEQIKIRKELKILGTGLLILGCIMSIMALVYIIGAV
jgi:hypothetical protein